MLEAVIAALSRHTKEYPLRCNPANVRSLRELKPGPQASTIPSNNLLKSQQIQFHVWQDAQAILCLFRQSSKVAADSIPGIRHIHIIEQQLLLDVAAQTSCPA